MKRTSYRTLFVTIALIMVGVGVAAAQGEITVIINDIEAVPVEGQLAYEVTAFVTVTDAGGQPVTALSGESFVVNQDGEDVTLESARVTERSVSIVLALDTSGSMAYQGKIEAVKGAAARFLDNLKEGDSVGVIYFNEEIVRAQDLSDDLLAARTIIDLLQAQTDAGTCLYDAAYNAVSTAVAAPLGRRAVILLTDGIDEMSDGSTCSEHTIEDVVSLASGGMIHVPIYTIGVGNRVDADDLRRIAENTGGDALIAPEASDVDTLFETVAAQLKSQYALVYRTATTSGEHTINVTVSVDGLSGVATRTFLAPELPAILSLSGLDDGAILEGERTVSATVSGKAKLVSVSFSLDGEALVEDTEAPFEVSLSSASLEIGVHKLTATGTLDDGLVLEAELQFAVQAAVVSEEEDVSEEQPVEEEIAAVGAGASAVPGWLLPGIGGAVIVLVGVVLLLVRGRRPGGQVIGGGVSMPTMVSAADVLATLTVKESLSLMQWQVFDLTGEVTRLGRGVDNHIVVPDAPVSREQAEIRVEGGAFLVYDLESRYGTFVNGERVGAGGLPIGDGDELRLGTRTIMFFAVARQPEAAPEDLTMDIAADTVQHIFGDEGRTESVSGLDDASTRPIADDDASTRPVEMDDGATMPLEDVGLDKTIQASDPDQELPPDFLDSTDDDASESPPTRVGRG